MLGELLAHGQLFGISINPPSNSGGTPLHFACFANHPDAVKVLVRSGGLRPNLMDNNGRTPLHIAAMQGHTEVIEELLVHHALDINMRVLSRDSETALHLASLVIIFKL
eukprot:TRINITY_DN40960_c0_g1_i1.p2 TRINITY_DN40960_c0_g1~~TRINITY_DN40960_c0_g1_i1.p2  ORF type:complete len:109 (+),score=4.31 TRINITY_DN40960_c0_g1_i1:187-513(+)